MSLIRRKLMSNDGYETYRIRFSAVVNSESKVYYDRDTKNTYTGVGFQLNAGGWKATAVEAVTGVADFPITTSIKIKDTNNNIIIEDLQEVTEFSEQHYVDGVSKGGTINNASIHFSYIIPDGEYIVEIMMKAKKIFLRTDSKSVSSPFYGLTSKLICVNTYSASWDESSSSSKSASKVSTICYCFKELLNLSPNNIEKLTFNMAQYKE